MKQTIQSIDFTRVNNDINGNPRFVCHYLNFINNDKDFNIGTKDMTANEVVQYVYGMSKTDYAYKLALKRSRELGGRKFHNKQYGGGIVFQMYEGQIPEMSRRIREIANR